MKRLAGLSALALIISSTSGCGWLWGEDGYFRDRGSDYLQARPTAPMQLPPDASNVKRLDPLLPIPRNVADDSATGEFEVPRPQPMTGGAAQVTDYSPAQRQQPLGAGPAFAGRGMAGGSPVLRGQWLPHRRRAPADR